MYLDAEMPIHALSPAVVLMCIALVQLDYEVVQAGGPSTNSAQQWVVSRPNVHDKYKQVDLSVIPGFAMSGRLDRAVTDFAGKRRRKFIYGTSHNAHGYSQTYIRNYTETRM